MKTRVSIKILGWGNWPSLPFCVYATECMSKPFSTSMKASICGIYYSFDWFFNSMNMAVGLNPMKPACGVNLLLRILTHTLYITGRTYWSVFNGIFLPAFLMDKFYVSTLPLFRYTPSCWWFHTSLIFYLMNVGFLFSFIFFFLLVP